VVVWVESTARSTLGERSLDPRAVKILVVCHANVTRSVAAAYLLSRATVPAGRALELRTAGTHAGEGQPVSVRTRDALSKVTGSEPDLRGYRSHQLVGDDLVWADLVIVMEGSQVRLLRRLNPDSSSKVATIAFLARELPSDDRHLAVRVASMGLEHCLVVDDADVVDPAGGDDDAYEATMSRLVELCEALAARIGS
jgi:protein-tyrosine-phosphatase